MNRKAEMEGIQYQIILVAEAILGVMIGLSILFYVNTTIVFSTVDVVARDLALTLSTAVSSPHNITVNYKPNTDDYRISTTADQVTVDGPKSTSQAPIIGSEYRTVRENQFVRYKPSFLITTDGAEVQIDDSGASLSDFCEVLREKDMQRNVTVQLYQDFRQPLDQAIEDRDGVNSTNVENATIILDLDNSNQDKFEVFYSEEADEGYQKIACRIASKVRAASKTGQTSFEEVSLARKELLSPITIQIGYPSEIKPELAETIAQSIPPR